MGKQNRVMPPSEVEKQPAAVIEHSRSATRKVLVEVSLAETPSVAAIRHVELQLSPDQSYTLARLFDAAYGAELASGRRVDTAGRAIQWLLEGLMRAAPDVAV